MLWGLEVAKCNGHLWVQRGWGENPLGVLQGKGTAGTRQGYGRDTAGPSAGHGKAGEGAGIAERTKYGNLDKTELK